MESKIDGIESEFIVRLQRWANDVRKAGYAAGNTEYHTSLNLEEVEYLLGRCQPIQMLDEGDLRDHVVGEVNKALEQLKGDEVEFHGALMALGGNVIRVAAGAVGSGYKIEDGLYGLVRMEDVPVGVMVPHDD